MSNNKKLLSLFNKIVLPHLKRPRHIIVWQDDHVTLIIVDTFQGQGNNATANLCTNNNFATVIVPHNLTNEFQSLEIKVNRPAKYFISDKRNKKGFQRKLQTS